MTDPKVANRIYVEMCRLYDQQRKDVGNGVLQPAEVVAKEAADALRLQPANYVTLYMRRRYASSKRVKAGKRDDYLDNVSRHLTRIFEETSFAKLPNIRAIGRGEIAKLVDELRSLKRTHPKPYPDEFVRLPAQERKSAEEAFDKAHNRLADATIRVMLMALSGLISHAIDNDDYGKSNPLSRHKMVPSQYAYHQATFLEMDQARQMLEVLESQFGHHRNRFAYEMVAVLFYTGARVTEMFNMAPWHVDFAGNRVLIYGTKTEHSQFRRVPLWPALKRLLLAFYRREGLLDNPRKRDLLFPGRPRAGRNGEVKAQPRQSMARVLERVARDAGIEVHVHAQLTRHTYAAARLSMVNEVNGRRVNVTKHEIAMELGHDGDRMLDKVYGHVLCGRYGETELDYSKAPRLNPDVVRAVS